jgi:hypothetical protein
MMRYRIAFLFTIIFTGVLAAAVAHHANGALVIPIFVLGGTAMYFFISRSLEPFDRPDDPAFRRELRLWLGHEWPLDESLKWERFVRRVDKMRNSV